MSIGAMKTPGGYRFDETFSALQKCIRSGDERGALYWAIELEPEFYPHLWNRLEIISHEDVGLANPELSVLIYTWKIQHKEMVNRKNSAKRLVLANAILALCRSPKSRQADTFCNAVYRSDEYLEIPDVAKDKHTAAGRQMGRGWQHFFEVGVVCANDTDVDDPYREEAERFMTAGAPFKYDGMKKGDVRKGSDTRQQGPEEQQETQLGF
ncbi:MAG: hypothetical protein H8E48_06675 [Chloroflexi bacterium]|nr:hypothetical protein [Chloroflexota bacterium]